MTKWDLYIDFYEDYKAAIEAAPSTEFAMDTHGFENIFSMTPIECWMWEEMRNNRIVMYPQYPILGIFLDFANPKAKVAIECDGKQFHLDWKKDAARDARLKAIGWTVYRFTGRECWEEPDFESGNSTEGQLLLAEVCKKHQIQRITKPSGWISCGLQPGVPA